MLILRTLSSHPKQSGGEGVYYLLAGGIFSKVGIGPTNVWMQQEQCQSDHGSTIRWMSEFGVPAIFCLFVNGVDTVCSCTSAHTSTAAGGSPFLCSSAILSGHQLPAAARSAIGGPCFVWWLSATPFGLTRFEQARAHSIVSCLISTTGLRVISCAWYSSHWSVISEPSCFVVVLNLLVVGINAAPASAYF